MIKVIFYSVEYTVVIILHIYMILIIYFIRWAIFKTIGCLFIEDVYKIIGKSMIFKEFYTFLGGIPVSFRFKIPKIVLGM